MPDVTHALDAQVQPEALALSGQPAHSLNLSPIGNCMVSALIDPQGRWVWSCAPRFDSDPVFSSLVSGVAPDSEAAQGLWSIEVIDQVAVRQAYARNSAVLHTWLTDADGAEVEIIDFCPRFERLERLYSPVSYCRIVRPVKGAARIRVRLSPTRNYGEALAETTFGSNHIRYLCADTVLRLTTNCPVSHILEAREYRLEEEQIFFLGPDESFSGELRSTVHNMLEKTDRHWKGWVRGLALPLEYQAEVIRAAIGLKLCVYEETGAIIAAMTTSVPEAPHSQRNWDYRYCWIRDAYYVVQALTRLGTMQTLENYLKYLRNIVDRAEDGQMQPVYGIGFETVLAESEAPHLKGYRGMGPVRVGNLAYVQHQHDVYGQIILSSVHAFFDQRLLRPGTVADFEQLEAVGDKAFEVFDQPDAGLWEFRTFAKPHTYSAVMCWAACDRLSNAATVLGLSERAMHWKARADHIRTVIDERAQVKLDTGEVLYSSAFDVDEVDASILQLIDLRYIPPDDPRYLATLAAVEKGLRRGPHMLRYALPDDFGEPETAFNFCTFWLIEALHFAGRSDEARELFEGMLKTRTPAGLLSEDTSFEDGTLWGNYPQTYSLVGIINCAVLLSRPWKDIR
ncbi:MAG: glycoside hydrolase family 15 protein [Asticcacaulis sp.]